MQLCKLTIVKETKKVAAAISSYHVVLIRSYTISSCTVTNDSKFWGLMVGKYTANKHAANISGMRQTGNI